LIVGMPVSLPCVAMPLWRNALVGTATGAALMQLKSKEIDYRELVINCLAIVMLLAAGVVWGAG
jgi:uncharacterized membrane protein YfcA